MPAPNTYCRLLSFVVEDPETNCHLWTGKTDRGGYGVVHFHGKAYRAHRFFYTHERGPIPAGLHLDHLCRVRHCVNPAHLEPVTQAENISRGFAPPALNARKNLCVRGHEFTPENTYRWSRRPNDRSCRACNREHVAERARRLREESSKSLGARAGQ